MYFLDGYNLLFSLTDSDHPLRAERQKIIRFLQKRFAALKLVGILVFDGRVRLSEESGRAYKSPLEIIYTQKGQSADDYIEEKVELSKNPKLITVVTNDRMLIANARRLGAKTMSNRSLLKRLSPKKQETLKPEISDSKQNIARLLAIFEKKLHTDRD